MPNNSEFDLPIIGETEISTAFVKANLALLQKFNLDIKKETSPKSKSEKLKSLWFQEYGVFLVEQENQFISLRFRNDKELTLFLMRWS